MPATPDPNEARRQRHDFILRYYDMATKDLERHLKAGWETIAVAAGAVALLSSAQQGYLPIPIATMLAVSLAFWGILHIIDANYWASRAIAFLANVESVYFYEKDREVFNPYAGQHPPAKFLDSLLPNLKLMFAVILAAGMYFALSAARRAPTYAELRAWAQVTHWLRLAMWLLPIAAFVGGSAMSFGSWVKRKRDYLDFVTRSPGPGMLRNRNKYRDVLLSGDADAEDITPGPEIQKNLRESLSKSVERLSPWSTWVQRVAVIIELALIALVLFKGRVFP